MVVPPVIAALLLSGIARYDIEIPGRWSEPLTIYSATIAEPGERKSAVVKACMAPIHKLSKRLRKDRLRMELFLAAVEESKERGEQPPPSPDRIRLITTDATPEAAQAQLALNGLIGIGEVLGLVDAEGGLFDTIFGTRYKDHATPEVFLKGNTGEPCAPLRIGRETSVTESPRLVVCAVVQSDVMRSLTEVQAVVARGGLARISIITPVSNIGHRTVDVPGAPDETVSAYSSLILRLGRIYPVEPRGEFIAERVALRPDAIEVVDTFARLAEADLLEGRWALERSKAHREYGAKLVGLALRLAGVLHFAVHILDAPQMQVDRATMEGGVALAEWFAAHTRAALDVLDLSPLDQAVQLLRAHLQRHAWDRPGDPITQALLWDRVRRTAPFGSRQKPSAQQILFDEAIGVLETAEVVRLRQTPQKSATGRPPTPTLDLHPDLGPRQPGKPDQPQGREPSLSVEATQPEQPEQLSLVVDEPSLIGFIGSRRDDPEENRLVASACAASHPNPSTSLGGNSPLWVLNSETQTSEPQVGPPGQVLWEEW